MASPMTAPNAPGGAPLGGGAPSSMGPIVKLGPQRTEELEGVGKTAAETREQNIAAGGAAQMQQASLMAMKADAPNFYTGPFADHVQQARSLLRFMAPDSDIPNEVASYEDFNKNSGLLVRQAVHDQSPRAAVQEFRLITSQLPNNEMSPMGLNRTINEFMGLNDYRIAKSAAQQQWEQRQGSNGPGDVSGFENNWQNTVSPYAFIVARMEPADRQKLFAQVSQTKGGQAELDHLTEQVRYIQSSGLDQALR